MTVEQTPQAVTDLRGDYLLCLAAYAVVKAEDLHDSRRRGVPEQEGDGFIEALQHLVQDELVLVL